MSNNAKILITGATGSVGKELTKYLSAKGILFRAMVRSLEDAREIASLPGADLIQGNFDDPQSVKKAVEGIEKVFLLTNSSEKAEKQQCAFVDIAAHTGVKHVVKLSQWGADINSPVRFLRYHAVVENFIKESGMNYTFLRPNLFMQGLLGYREIINEQSLFFGAIGSAKISLIDVRDIAAVAAEALITPGHDRKIYNLTGPEALTHTEIAEKLSIVTGREIRFVDISPEILKSTLLNVGFPEWQAEGLVEDYAHYKREEAAEILAGVKEATGLAPRSFDTFAKDYSALFSA
jgi:uncharacterized protein YbjT (DUF2867 family)